jgi:predicted ATPase
MPASLSTFLGRRRELQELRGLLASTRLVTLVGTGGAGKTRLALQMATAAEGEFPGGCWLVDLARTEDPELVAVAIAESVGAAERPGVGALVRAADRLAAGRHLVVLDNCEHVLKETALATEHLLTRCPGVTILATSRVPLGVDGEQVWWSPGLGLPTQETEDLEAVALTDSVRLFCERARSNVSNFQLSEGNVSEVAAICRRLEGLPLALELAAGWVRVLSIKDIAARLDDLTLLGTGGANRQPGHRTMRAALDRSDQLLSDVQRRAFHRLSVFVGGFSMAGAEAVLSNLCADVAALELLASLVECSLISVDTTADETRYRLLEPVRQYAAEKLASRADEEAETRGRHLEWLATTAEAADEHILGGPDVLWLRRLDVELANIRAGLAWGFAEDPVLASRLAAGLVTYCVVRDLCVEGLSWARRAIAATEGVLQARCLYMAGLLAYHLDDTGSAAAYLGRARRLLGDGNPPESSMVAFAQALVAGLHKSDYNAMRAYANEALTLAREAGDQAREMYALETLAWHAARVGDRPRAIALLRERITIARQLDNRWTEAQSLSQIADFAVEIGDIATGLAAVREGLDTLMVVHARGQDSTWVAYMLESAAVLAIHGDDGVVGLRLLGATDAVFERMRFGLTGDEQTRRAELRQRARALIGDTTADAELAIGRTLTVQAAVSLAARAVAEQPAERHGLESFLPDQPAAPSPAATARTERSSDAVPANTFVREGDFWSLSYGGVVVRLKDSKGLRDIARLIAAPGAEMAAVDLAGVTTWGGVTRTAGVQELGLGVEGDAGAMLDVEARRQYRARLLDLEEEAEEAESANDPIRAERTRDEREFLLAELRAAVGLGGQGRRSVDPAERARKTVTWRIRDAMGRIEGAHPSLGRHLRRSLRTGTFCCYDPAEAPGGRF